MKDGRDIERDARLVTYLYGEMDRQEQVAFEESMAGDPELERQAEDLKRVMHLYRSQLTAVQPGAAVQARVLEEAARQSATLSLWQRLAALATVPARRYALGAAVSVLVVCAAVVAVYRLKGRPAGPDETHRRSVPSRPESASHEKAAARPEGKNTTVVAEADAPKDEAPPSLPRAANGAEDGFDRRGPASSVSSPAMGFVDDGLKNRPGSGGKAPVVRGKLRQVTGKTSLALNGRKSAPRTGSFRWRGKDKQKSQGKRGWANGRGDNVDGLVGTANRAVTGGSSGVTRQQQLYRTGVALQQKGKHRQAVNYFSQATAGYPRRDEVLLRWAESEMKLGNYARAEKLLAMIKGRTTRNKESAKRIARKIQVLRSRRAAQVMLAAPARPEARARPAARKQAQRKAARPVPQSPPRKK